MVWGYRILVLVLWNLGVLIWPPRTTPWADFYYAKLFLLQQLEDKGSYKTGCSIAATTFCWSSHEPHVASNTTQYWLCESSIMGRGKDQLILRNHGMHPSPQFNKHCRGSSWDLKDCSFRLKPRFLYNFIMWGSLKRQKQALQKWSDAWSPAASYQMYCQQAAYIGRSYCEFPFRFKKLWIQNTPQWTLHSD